MEDSLVTTNIRQRPMRTLISVVGVALGVVLIVLVVGLSRGMLKEQGRRSSNVGAELIFARPIRSASGLYSWRQGRKSRRTVPESLRPGVRHGVSRWDRLRELR